MTFRPKLLVIVLAIANVMAVGSSPAYADSAPPRTATQRMPIVRPTDGYAVVITSAAVATEVLGVVQVEGACEVAQVTSYDAGPVSVPALPRPELECYVMDTTADVVHGFSLVPGTSLPGAAAAAGAFDVPVGHRLQLCMSLSWHDTHGPTVVSYPSCETLD